MDSLQLAVEISTAESSDSFEPSKTEAFLQVDLE